MSFPLGQWNGVDQGLFAIFLGKHTQPGKFSRSMCIKSLMNRSVVVYRLFRVET